MLFLKQIAAILILILSAFSCVLSEQENVQVSVYYDALCPRSREFITEQLYPGYQTLGTYLILDLVPFGKADEVNTNGNIHFECPHGSRECKGNKLQACVLRQNHDQTAQIGFVNCMMNGTHPESPRQGRICASESSISWRPIQRCIDTRKGDRSLKYFAQKTLELNPQLPHVPHIRFNGHFNQSLEDNARDNFLATVCDLFSVKPTACK